MPRPAHAGLFSISTAKERSLGDEAARDIEAHSKIVSGPVADWVSTIGERLAAVSDPEFKYSFVVIDGDEVNAFTLPGGYVYIYTGMRKVCRSDDELAAVLAHEITHAEQHHYAKQYSSSQKRGIGLTILTLAVGMPYAVQQGLDVFNYATTQKYSREDENEADHLGMLRMTRAGFNPEAMVDLLDNLSKEDGKTDVLDRWFGDHPEGIKRAAAARKEMGEIKEMKARNDPTVQVKFPMWQGSDVLTSSAVSTP